MPEMYELREADLSPSGIDEIAALLQRVFPGATHLNPAYFDWQYNRNPAGTAIAFNGYHAGVLIAHYGTLPVRLRLFGEEALGALILNLAVVPGHQRRGLMTELGNRAHALARDRGIACEYGVANTNSTHGHERTFGFQHVCALEARLGLGRIPPGTRECELEFDRIWDRDTLRWRLANPSRRYLVTRRAEACQVRVPSPRPGVDVLLGEIDASLVEPSPSRSCLRAKLWLGTDPSRDWSRSPYWNLPQRLRPVPLNFMFKDLGPRNRRLDPRRVHLVGLDFDAY